MKIKEKLPNSLKGWAVFSLSLIIWTFGIAQFCLALWLLFENNVVQRMIRMDISLQGLHASFFLLLVVGAFVSITAYTGWIGAMRKSKLLLCLFALILIISCGGELANSVMGGIQRAQVDEYVKSSLNTVVTKEYGIILPNTNILDSIQIDLNCCGVASYKDWLSTNFGNSGHFLGNHSTTENEVGRVPLSCCNSIGVIQFKGACGIDFNDKPLSSYSEYVNVQGCTYPISEEFYKKFDVLIGISVCNFLVQLLGIIATIMLVVQMKRL